jgi:hypothetical protein
MVPCKKRSDNSERSEPVKVESTCRCGDLALLGSRGVEPKWVEWDFLDYYHFDSVITVKCVTPSASPFIAIARFSQGCGCHSTDMIQYQATRYKQLPLIAIVSLAERVSSS